MLLLDILVLVLILRLTGKSRTAGKMRTYRAILTVLTVFNALAAVALMVSDQWDWAVIGVEAAALVIDVIGFIQLKKVSVMPEQTVPQTESNQQALQAEETASVEDSPEPASREVFRKVREPGAAAKRFLLFILMVVYSCSFAHSTHLFLVGISTEEGDDCGLYHHRSTVFDEESEERARPRRSPGEEGQHMALWL